MNEHISGELIDENLKLIENLASNDPSMNSVLRVYSDSEPDFVDARQGEAYRVVGNNAWFLYHSFVGILQREPEIGAFRYYIPDLIWGKRSWSDHLREFSDLPEVISRLVPHQTMPAAPIGSPYAPKMKDIVTGLERILINANTISDDQGRLIAPPSAMQLPGDATEHHLDLALELVLAVEDVQSARRIG